MLCALRASFLLFGGRQKAADPVPIIPSDQGTSASPYGSRGDCRVLGTLLIFFSAAPQGMWDLSSATRDRTRAPCSGSAES